MHKLWWSLCAISCLASLAGACGSSASPTNTGDDLLDGGSALDGAAEADAARDAATGVDAKVQGDAEVTDAEVTDAEVADAEVADAEVTDAEVTDAEVTDAEVTDAEVTDDPCAVDTADDNPCNAQDIDATCASADAPDTGFICTCSAGYAGDTCLVDVNGCAEADAADQNPCNAVDTAATCVDAVAPQAGYLCQCSTGFDGTSGACVDVDQCDALDNPCDDDGDLGALCTDGVDAHACTCSLGFDGSTGACVAASCAAILSATPTAPDGIYRIDPDGLDGLAPFQATCDMTTYGGGWTLCGNIDEYEAEYYAVCVLEEASYVPAAGLINRSFCAKLHAELATGEMMVHNRTPTTSNGGVTLDYGFGDRLFIDWSADPITVGTYDNTPVSCHHLDADGVTVTVFDDCRYASHDEMDSLWQQAAWSFTDGLDNGYADAPEQRVMLGPTFTSCSSDYIRLWYNFGAGTNATNVTNDWYYTWNVGDLYLR